MDTEAASLIKGEEPVCSVCIANFNGRHVLEACLDSVFRQDFPYPVEVIVHDDASTDGSADIVTEKFPAVRLINSDRNVGFCVSNNHMVAAAKGRFVLLLNNDAALYKDALSTLYNCAIGENIYGIIGLPQHDMQTGELLDIGSLFDPFLNPIPNKNKARRNVGMVMGACMWLPKKLWDELGGFPEWFESIGEDLYLCCRARLAGYSVRTLDRSGYRHRVGGSFGGGKVAGGRLVTTFQRRALSERNKTFTMILCYPLPWIQLILPIHLGLLLFEGVLLSLLKRDVRLWRDIYWHCLRELWAKRNLLREQRHRIQIKRKVSAAVFFEPHTLLPHKLRMLFRHGLPAVR
jgi:GT2 family glycosyltransferase